MRNRHQLKCPVRTGGDCCMCDLDLPSIEDIKARRETPKCPGCVEKEKRLIEAVDLLRRGVKMLQRVGWEKGETDDEWRQKAASYLTHWDMEVVAYLKSLKEPTTESARLLQKPLQDAEIDEDCR